MKYKINSKYEKDFKEFLLNIKSYFQNSNDSIHKARNELKIINHNGLDVVVKSFKVPHIINKFVYSYFRYSKAKKSYEYSLKISNFTPTPIGYIEFYDGGFIGESYFVSEKFDYDFTIREPLLDDAFPNKEEILREFARFSYDLHENGIFHNDYSPGNILVKQENDKYIFKIVDINRMKFGPLNLEMRAKNFSKLWARDDELEIIGDEYAKASEEDCEVIIKRMQYYNTKNKNIKNFKKRLKGQEVND